MTNRIRTWSDAGVFLAVARAGSTLAASKTLGISQNTVSRRIDELEARLGLDLFERDTRGFRPTKEGVALISSAEKIETAAQLFETRAAEMKPSATAPIRLTASEANFNPEFSKILSQFLEENPGLTLNLLSSDATLDLITGEADVAIRHGQRIDDERLFARKVGTVRSTIYASVDYARSRDLPASATEARDHPLVIFSHSGLLVQFPELADHPKIVSDCDTVRAAIAAIRSGFGVGALPTLVADGQAGLVRCFDPPEGAASFTWVVASPSARKRPEVRKLTKWLGENMRAWYRDRGL